MAESRDRVQADIVINGRQAINELGALELELKGINEEMRRAKKGTEAFRELDARAKANKERMAELRKELGHAGMTMRQLRQYSGELGRELDNATAGTEKYEELSARLREVSAEMKRQKQELSGTAREAAQYASGLKKIRAEAGLGGMTLRQLSDYQGVLNAEMSGMSRGSAGYRELRMEMQRTDAALGRMRREIAGTNTLWHSIGAEARQFGMMALTYLGAQELIGQIGNLVRGLANLSDSIADVQKTTGLSAKEVEELNNELKKLDTRTSRKDLLDLASIAGKLGVSAKKDVLEFVKAADKINVALGGDLGGNAEETIKQVGKLAEIFKLKDRFGLEQSLLKVGSAINSLGAASSAAEGYLVDFAKRMGGIAPSAKISAPDILALGATMDQLGQSSETSSTALAQLLVAMAQDMPSFAKLAGQSLQEFSSILAEDANEVLIMVLEGAKSTEGGLAGMSATLQKLGIDGARSAAVVGVLSENTELLRKQQELARKEFEAGTSILKEYEVKNTNLAAVVEKIQKRLAGIFINSGFMKGLESALSGFERLIRANRDFSEGLRGQEAQMRRVRAEFNADMRTLMEGNIPAEARAKLIARMNEAYKEYLPQLITEKTELSELAQMQAHANKLMLERIAMMAQEASIMEKLSKIRELQRQNDADQDALLDARRKVNEAKEASGSLGVGPARWGVRNRKGAQAKDEADALSKAVKLREEEIKLLEQAIDREDELTKKVLGRLIGGKDAGDELPKWPNKPSAPAPAEPEGGKEGKAREAEIDRTIEKWRELQAKVLKAKDEAWASGQVDFQSELAEIDRKYEALLDEAQSFRDNMKVGDAEYNEAVQQLIASHAQEVQAKAKELNEGLAAENKAKNEKILQDDLEFWGAEADARRAAMEQEAADRQKRLQDTADMYSAMGGLLSEFSSLLSATNSLIAQQGESQSEFQRQLALVNIAIDTAVSISKAIAGAATAAASTGPAAPFTFAAYMVSMVGSVVSGFAKAKAFLDSDTPQAPTFYHGGPTGDGPAIGYDRYGKIVGGVHKDEYVVSSRLLGIPWVANQVAIMEAIRVGRAPEPQSMPGPAQGAGGGGSAGGGESALAAALLSRLDRLEAAVLSLDKPARAYFSRDEAEAMNRYFDKENENRLNSRL